MRTAKLCGAIVAALLSMNVMGADKAENTAKGAGVTAEDPVTILLLVPVETSRQTMNQGCWAQLFEERNFKGDAFTMIGPMQLDTVDKAAGRSFRRNTDSLITGPKATLTFYEHRMFKDKAVKFAPNSKEGGLIKKLGFSGRIESIKLECAG